MADELQIAGATGQGALSGGLTGAQFGGAPGAAIGAAVGGVGSFMKANNASQANQAINAQDPQELARLAEINRIRKSIGAGTDSLTQQGIKAAQQTGATTQERIARSTGGDVGATIAGLTRAQSGTQAATNQAVLGAQQRLPFFENMGQQLSTRISQRALEVGLQQRDQAMAEKAAHQKSVSANMAGALAMMGNGGGLDGAAGAPGAAGAAGTKQYTAGPQAAGTTSSGTDMGPQNWNPNAVVQGPFDNFDAGVNKSQAETTSMGPQNWNPNAAAPGPFDNFNAGNAQSSQAPEPSDYKNFQYGQGFDPNSVLGPNGLPTAPPPTRTPDGLNEAMPLLNAMNTASQNIDRIGNLPTKVKY